MIQNRKYKCKNNITLIYLTFIHCTCKLKKQHKQFSSVKNMNKLSLIKALKIFRT